MGKALKRWWPLFMLPTCLAFMIGFVIPFIQGFYLSFCQFITINNAHFVGIENYVRALSDPQFSTSFFFTVAFAFLSTVLINVIALAIAQALTRKALKGTNIFRTIFFMPNLIGGIVLGLHLADSDQLPALQRGCPAYRPQLRRWLLGPYHPDPVATGRLHDDHLHRRPAEHSGRSVRGGPHRRRQSPVSACGASPCP